MGRRRMFFFAGLVIVGGAALVAVDAGHPQPDAKQTPSPDLLRRWWTDLAGADAAQAYRVQLKMIENPKAVVPFLSTHLKPSPPVATKHITKLVSQLEHRLFQRRVEAQAKLKQIGSAAKPFLEEALDDDHSAELKWRAELLLQYMQPFRFSAAELQSWRGIEVLESIGSDSAKQTLRRLGAGPKGRLTTDKAKEALARLARTRRPLEQLKEFDYQKQQLAESPKLPKNMYVIRFSSNGRMLAASGQSGHIVLWNVSPWKKHAQLTGYRGTIYGLAFSSNGKTLATGSISPKEPVKLWDVASGKLIDTLPDFSKGVGAFTFSPDGKYLVMAGPYKKKNDIVFWDRFQRQIVRTWKGHTGNVRCLVYSPDGRTLASGSYDDTARLWKTATGKSRTILKNGKDVLDLAFSSDGRLIATTFGTGLKLWNAQRGEMIGELASNQRKVMDVSFSADGRIVAAAGQDRTMRLWDVKSRQVLATVTGHSNYIRCVDFRGDGGTFATGSYDKTIRLWSWRALLAGK